jgi:hypothetical protein
MMSRAPQYQDFRCEVTPDEWRLIDVDAERHWWQRIVAVVSIGIPIGVIWCVQIGDPAVTVVVRVFATFVGATLLAIFLFILKPLDPTFRSIASLT